MQSKLQKYWLVVMPLSQYNEDVKQLAKDGNLVIIDARFSDSADKDRITQDVPKLTKKRKKRAAKPSEDAQQDILLDSETQQTCANIGANKPFFYRLNKCHFLDAVECN